MKEKNILNAIGNTPLIRVKEVYAKLETVNPTGSVKDRIAKYLVGKAEERGELKPGFTIIEATSGNTGISLAMISAIKGYKFIAVMPENIGREKRKLMELFGADFVLTPENHGLAEAIQKTESLAKEYKKVWLPRQFANPDNVEAHRSGLGREILEGMKKVDAFVAGIGTGGTLMGVAKALRARFPEVKVFGVEADEKNHKIEGISDGLIPDILDMGFVDGILKIKSEEAIKTAKRLIEREGLLVGISSGANYLAAQKLAENYGNVVTVFPDRAERYLELW